MNIDEKGCEPKDQTAATDEKTIFEMKVKWDTSKGYGFITAHKNGEIDQSVLAQSPAHVGQIVRDIIEGYKPTKFLVFCQNQQFERIQPERELDYVVSNAKIQALENQPSNSCHACGAAL